MKWTRMIFRTVAVSLLLMDSLAQASTLLAR